MQKNSSLNSSSVRAVVLQKNKTSHGVLILSYTECTANYGVELIVPKLKGIATPSWLDFHRFNITSFKVSETVTELRNWDDKGS